MSADIRDIKRYADRIKNSTEIGSDVQVLGKCVSDLCEKIKELEAETNERD